MNTNNTNESPLPFTGLRALKAYWKSDLTSGFMVFLLALPLSLGIAKASGFPASMGIITAMIGGLITVWFRVSELSIKGPAAGLITISSGAVLAFGGGDTGWHVACAAIILAAVLQLAIGFLRLGSFSDFFPPAAVHGMLAAIGLIIILKQIPVLLGDDPTVYSGESPIELLIDIPYFISHAHWHIAVVGILGLVIMFGLPLLGFQWLKKIPAPMLVLFLTIPLSIYWHFEDSEPSYSLVHIGDFWGSLSISPDFRYIHTAEFWKFVFLFFFINSLESLLTVKAVDQLDHSPRKADPNGDLAAVGVGNILSGALGGLSMISEVVRSSANISFGAKSKWSNFFHGVFLLIAMLLLIPWIELIPNAALAAMLIYAGYRLASPKEFLHVLHIGKEQLLVFIVTIVVTLAEDLLLGILVGILVKLVIHIRNGVPIHALFSARYLLTSTPSAITIEIKGPAIFSNLLGFKKCLNKLPEKEVVIMDMHRAILIDHSFMNFIHYFQSEYNSRGGNFKLIGLENHRSLSNHPDSAKILKTDSVGHEK